MAKLKFVSYDGGYPNLCSGTLVLSLDGENITFPDYCLSSGGSINWENDDEPSTTQGSWRITEWPEGFPEYLKAKAIELVNDHIELGCCGGCI